MRHYETLVLLSSQVTDDELASFEKTIASLIKAAGGSVALFDKWGKYRLAYPVRKQDYGIYILVRYTLAEVTEFFKKFNTFLQVKCVETVMRHVHVALSPAQAKAQYAKPDSLEGNAGSVDTFLKESNMDDLIEGADDNAAPARHSGRHSQDVAVEG